ncbi:MAG: NUDIX hydrolase [Deltaproteobacteria bacterium]|nr:MAG: NUDIX hydrolase [Deltaproteobacteria bacterium]
MAPARLATRLVRLAEILPVYASLAWWGLVSPRLSEREPLVVVQAVIRSERGVLLTVRRDLRGWELPGGNARPGESEAQALQREVLEETGLAVEVVCLTGEYVRTGFRPHTARVYACRAIGGTPRPSRETPEVRWFDPDLLPDTLFPWYRKPIADALSTDGAAEVHREHQGLSAVLRGMRIDLRMRASGDAAR